MKSPPALRREFPQWTTAVGERQARKLSPIYNLQYFAPSSYSPGFHWAALYWAHLFDHPKYGEPDSRNKAVFTDPYGVDYRLPVKPDCRKGLFND